MKYQTAKILFYSGQEYPGIYDGEEYMEDSEKDEFLKTWEFIENHDYWDGSEDRYTGFIWKNKVENKFYLVRNYYSSWDFIEDIDVYSVIPQEVKTIQYKIEKSIETEFGE